MTKVFYKRDLPHWHPPGASIFLTWRLFGSLPQTALDRLSDTRRLLQREIARADEIAQERRVRHFKKLFAAVDAMLDNAESGPLWLKEPRLASIVEAALLSRYAERYRLWAYVVMANHIHVFLQPKIVELPDEPQPAFVKVRTITKRLKGYTAREANRLLKREGKTFWQVESFDHWSRNEAEFHRIIRYIENNPVKAGLVARAEDWP